MKTLKKSNSEAVLTAGAGGSPEATPQTPLSSSLRLGGNLGLSSALAPDTRSTPHGGPQSGSGKKPALTGKSESTTPNLTLAGTLNWVLAFLIRRKLIVFGLVRDANGQPEYYQARFPVSTWEMRDNLLVLTDEG